MPFTSCFQPTDGRPCKMNRHARCLLLFFCWYCTEFIGKRYQRNSTMALHWLWIDMLFRASRFHRPKDWIWNGVATQILDYWHLISSCFLICQSTRQRKEAGLARNVMKRETCRSRCETNLQSCKTTHGRWEYKEMRVRACKYVVTELLSVVYRCKSIQGSSATSYLGYHWAIQRKIQGYNSAIAI